MTGTLYHKHKISQRRRINRNPSATSQYCGDLRDHTRSLGIGKKHVLVRTSHTFTYPALLHTLEILEPRISETRRIIKSNDWDLHLRRPLYRPSHLEAMYGTYRSSLNCGILGKHTDHSSINCSISSIKAISGITLSMSYQHLQFNKTSRVKKLVKSLLCCKLSLLMELVYPRLPPPQSSLLLDLPELLNSLFHKIIHSKHHPFSGTIAQTTIYTINRWQRQYISQRGLTQPTSHPLRNTMTRSISLPLGALLRLGCRKHSAGKLNTQQQNSLSNSTVIMLNYYYV